MHFSRRPAAEQNDYHVMSLFAYIRSIAANERTATTKPQQRRIVDIAHNGQRHNYVDHELSAQIAGLVKATRLAHLNRAHTHTADVAMQA